MSIMYQYNNLIGTENCNTPVLQRYSSLGQNTVPKRHHMMAHCVNSCTTHTIWTMTRVCVFAVYMGPVYSTPRVSLYKAICYWTCLYPLNFPQKSSFGSFAFQMGQYTFNFICYSLPKWTGIYCTNYTLTNNGNITAWKLIFTVACYSFDRTIIVMVFQWAHSFPYFGIVKVWMQICSMIFTMPQSNDLS